MSFHTRMWALLDSRLQTQGVDIRYNKGTVIQRKTSNEWENRKCKNSINKYSLHWNLSTYRISWYMVQYTVLSKICFHMLSWKFYLNDDLRGCLQRNFSSHKYFTELHCTLLRPIQTTVLSTVRTHRTHAKYTIFSNCACPSIRSFAMAMLPRNPILCCGS